MDDHKLNLMLEEATRRIPQGNPLQDLARRFLATRRLADRRGRRYPPLDQYQDKLDQMAEILDMEYR